MAVKPTFETERIQELKNERINLQKKTFSKWMNTFLQNDCKVKDIFQDLSDGRVLIKLLEAISGEKVGRIARGKQRIHKLENVSKALTFLQKSVKLESIGPEDVVDGKQDLILGLLWMIILRFQISEVQNESGSNDAKSAKEALLIWCQRKTKGYPGVDIRNFTTSWKNGLAFNALIHKHRPDLLDFAKLQPSLHSYNLSNAFEIAEERLGVAKLLDPEDLDTPKPDEKSVMTYVSMLYQYFAKMKHEETGGKRIAKILDLLMEVDRMKSKYVQMVTDLMQWIAKKIEFLNQPIPNTTQLLHQNMNEFKTFRTADKPPKYTDRANIEEFFFIIQTKINANRHKSYRPPEGRSISDISKAWEKMEKAEHRREIGLREELARQEKLSQLAETFEKKASLREPWLDEMMRVLQTEENIKSTQSSDIKNSIKRHEAIETDIKARETKIMTIKKIADELKREKYDKSEHISKRMMVITQSWETLLKKLKLRRNHLVGLNNVLPLLSEIESLHSQLADLEANISVDEQMKQLDGINDLLQKHVLVESQIIGYQNTIRELKKAANALIQSRHPQVVLVSNKLQNAIKVAERVFRISNKKKKRLEESRDFYTFSQTVKEENVFIEEKAQLAASKEVGKNLISLTRLQKKLQSLKAEVEGCDGRCEAVCKSADILIDKKNSFSEHIKTMTDELQVNLKNLKSLTKIRAERLSEAAQSFQYYSDANDVESWIGEKMQLILSKDCGKDKQSTKSLLQRHEQITEEIEAFNDDMQMLQEQCMLIEKIDNQTEANQREASTKGKKKEIVEIEVETDTEEEEMIEREVEKKVVKEFKVPQVVAKHAYDGEGLSMKKGEIFYVASKTNKDWWSVRRVSSKESGYVPAVYMKEIEPKTFKKPVMEKVKVQEMVKVKRKKMKKVKVERESLVDKRAKRTSSILRKTNNNKRNRKPRFTQHFDRENVTTRQLAIFVAYAKLKKAAEERGTALKDALTYFEFCFSHNEMMTWIEDQIRYLTRWGKLGENIDVETTKKLLQKLENEISANEKSYLELKQQGAKLVEKLSGEKYDIKKRLETMIRRYGELLHIKNSREKDVLEGHGVELFMKSCAELQSWMTEKANYLKETKIGGNQESIRAAQRKHQNFEHELAAIKDKVSEIQKNAGELRQLHYSSIVDDKEKDIVRLWNGLKKRAAERKSVLQDAYGQQGFLADFKECVRWANETKKRFAMEEMPKDISIVEELMHQHKVQWNETQTNLERLEDLIENGESILQKNPKTPSLRNCINELKQLAAEIPNSWNKRNLMLAQCKDYLIFNRDADGLKSNAVVIQKLLSTDDYGVSVENVTTLQKQVEELSQKFSQRVDKYRNIIKSADIMIASGHRESESIVTKKAELIDCYEGALKCIEERQTALKNSLEFQQFRRDVEEFLSWMEDKLAIVNDECHRDLSNLQSKVLKHQALQAEVISNQTTKARLEQIGEELVSEHHFSSDEINELLDTLDDKWQQLEASSKTKSDALEQATKARRFLNEISDLDMWCSQLENTLSTRECGDDLASVRFFRNKQQLQEKEIEQRKADLRELESQLSQMLAEENFKSHEMQEQLKRIQDRMNSVSDGSDIRKRTLEHGHTLQQFLFDVSIQLNWLHERQAQISNAEYGTNLTTAQRLLNRHEALENEMKSHSASIEKLIMTAHEHVESNHPNSDVITVSCGQLEKALEELTSSFRARRCRLKQEYDAFQLLLDASDIESWLDEKTALVVGQESGRDLDAIGRILSKNQIFSEGLQMTFKNVASLRDRSDLLIEDGNPKGKEISQKQQIIEAKAKQMKRELDSNQKKLQSLQSVYQLFHDAENVRDWIATKHKLAAAEGYGKDYEHWQALFQKFDELKISIAAGEASYTAAIQLADGILAENGPHTPNVAGLKDKLSLMWTRLMDKIKQKNTRLAKAGELHKFNMQVGDITTRLHEKEAVVLAEDLGKDAISSEAHVRSHDAVFLELEAVGKQIEEAESHAQDLKQHYPGKTAEQIGKHQEFVKKNWSDLLVKAKYVRNKLHGNVEYHILKTEIGKLLSWCLETKDSIGTDQSVSSIDEAEEEMDRIDDLKLEIDGREDKFAFVVEAGEGMVNEEHHASNEIQQSLEELISQREELNSLWYERKNYLSESYDYLMFSREATRITGIFNSQKAILNSITSGNSAEELESLIRRIHKLMKMVESQNDKIQNLFELGNQLLSDGHMNSDGVKECMEDTLRIRDELENDAVEREKLLTNAAALANFRTDVEELKDWILEKTSRDSNISSIDMPSLNGLMRSYKSDLVEFESRGVAREIFRKSAERIVNENKGAASEVKLQLQEVNTLWDQLKSSLDARGKSFEMAKEILKLKRDIELAEVHVNEKETSLATDDTGKDFDDCQILRKNLDKTVNAMKADKERVEIINKLANKILKKRSEATEDVSVHVRLLNQRWDNLQELANARRKDLDKSLKVHQFRKDVTEVSSRMQEKIALLERSQVAEDLNGVQAQLRKHAVLESDLEVLEQFLEKLDADAHVIVEESPCEIPLIQEVQTTVIDLWETVVELSDQRQVVLQAAEHLYRFQTDIKTLSIWMKKVFNKMSSQQEARNVKEARLLLELHEELQPELKVREEVFERVHKYGNMLITEGGLPAGEVEPKLQQLDVEKKELWEIWMRRKDKLKESYDSLKFKTELDQIENWLDRKREDLSSSDVGNALEDVYRLLTINKNVQNSINSFEASLENLKKSGGTLLCAESPGSEVLRTKYENLTHAVKDAKVSAVDRGEKLRRSLLFLKFSNRVENVKSWILGRLKYTEDLGSLENCDDLQRQKNVFETFLAETSANESQLKELKVTAMELVEKDIEQPRVEASMESLLMMWESLEAASYQKQKLLDQIILRDKVTNDVRAVNGWFETVEKLLLSENVGKDVKSAANLQARHKEIELQICNKQNTLNDIEICLKSGRDNNPLLETVCNQFTDVLKRFEDLQQLSKSRRASLNQALEFFDICQEIDDEKSWMKDREFYLRSDDLGADLTGAEHLLKKVQSAEKEIESHESAINRLLEKVKQIPDSHKFADEIRRLRDAFSTDWDSLKKLVFSRMRRLEDSVFLHKFISDANQALRWLRDHLPALKSNEFGKDETNTRSLMRKNALLKNDLQGFQPTVEQLKNRILVVLENDDMDQSLKSVAFESQKTLIKEYQEIQELCLIRSKNLADTLESHNFQTEADNIAFWIEETLPLVSSEKYGKEVSDVVDLLKEFHVLSQDISTFEMKIEKIRISVKDFEANQNKDITAIRERAKKLAGLFSSLKEAATVRQQNLEKAKVIHEFNQQIEETYDWIRRKDGEIISIDLENNLKIFGSLQRAHDAFLHDMSALKVKVEQITDFSKQLMMEFPDVKERTKNQIKQLESQFSSLEIKTRAATMHLKNVKTLKKFLQSSEDMKLWMKDQLSAIKSNTNRLIAKAIDHENAFLQYKDHNAEKGARETGFASLIENGRKMIQENHEAKEMIGKEVSCLYENWNKLGKKLRRFEDDLEHTQVSEALTDDLLNLDSWLDGNIDDLGDISQCNLDEIEDMLKMQEDLEKSITVQEDRFQSVLGRLTKYARDVGNKLVTKVEPKANVGLDGSNVKSKGVVDSASTVHDNANKLSSIVKKEITKPRRIDDSVAAKSGSRIDKSLDRMKPSKDAVRPMKTRTDKVDTNISSSPRKEMTNERRTPTTPRENVAKHTHNKDSTAESKALVEVPTKSSKTVNDDVNNDMSKTGDNKKLSSELSRTTVVKPPKMNLKGDWKTDLKTPSRNTKSTESGINDTRGNKNSVVAGIPNAFDRSKASSKNSSQAKPISPRRSPEVAPKPGTTGLKQSRSIAKIEAIPTAFNANPLKSEPRLDKHMGENPNRDIAGNSEAPQAKSTIKNLIGTFENKYTSKGSQDNKAIGNVNKLSKIQATKTGLKEPDSKTSTSLLDRKVKDNKTSAKLTSDIKQGGKETSRNNQVSRNIADQSADSVNESSSGDTNASEDLKDVKTQPNHDTLPTGTPIQCGEEAAKHTSKQHKEFKQNTNAEAKLQIIDFDSSATGFVKNDKAGLEEDNLQDGYPSPGTGLNGDAAKTNSNSPKDKFSRVAKVDEAAIITPEELLATKNDFQVLNPEDISEPRSKTSNNVHRPDGDSITRLPSSGLLRKNDARDTPTKTTLEDSEIPNVTGSYPSIHSSLIDDTKSSKHFQQDIPLSALDPKLKVSLPDEPRDGRNDVKDEVNDSRTPISNDLTPNTDQWPVIGGNDANETHGIENDLDNRGDGLMADTDNNICHEAYFDNSQKDEEDGINVNSTESPKDLIGQGAGQIQRPPKPKPTMYGSISFVEEVSDSDESSTADCEVHENDDDDDDDDEDALEFFGSADDGAAATSILDDKLDAPLMSPRKSKSTSSKPILEDERKSHSLSSVMLPLKMPESSDAVLVDEEILLPTNLPPSETENLQLFDEGSVPFESFEDDDDLSFEDVDDPDIDLPILSLNEEATSDNTHSSLPSGNHASDSSMQNNFKPSKSSKEVKPLYGNGESIATDTGDAGRLLKEHPEVKLLSRNHEESKTIQGKLATNESKKHDVKPNNDFEDYDFRAISDSSGAPNDETVDKTLPGKDHSSMGHQIETQERDTGDNQLPAYKFDDYDFRSTENASLGDQDDFPIYPHKEKIALRNGLGLEKINEDRQNSDMFNSDGTLAKSPVPSIMIKDSGTKNLLPEDIDKDASDNDEVKDHKPQFAGSLECKQDLTKGRKSSNRSWRFFYAVVNQLELKLYYSEYSFKTSPPEKKFDLNGASIEVVPGYGSHDNVLRLRLADRSEYLFTTEDMLVLDEFLMAVSESTGMTSRDDTISLPPAPPPPQLSPPQIPPPQLPDDGSFDDFMEDSTSESLSKSFSDHLRRTDALSPQSSSNESDELDDVLPPAPVFHKNPRPEGNSRRMSLGLLEIVGKSTSLADNLSGMSSEDDSDSEFVYDPESLEKNRLQEEEEARPKKYNFANTWVSWPEEAYADETTPITPFGLDNDDQNNEFSFHSQVSAPTGGNRSPRESKRVSHGSPAAQPRASIPASASGPVSMTDSHLSPSKDHKKKGRFLGGIFRKKK